MADLRPVYVAGDGDVKGPANSSNNFLPLFADTTGKLLKSSGTGVTTQGLAILDDNTPAEQRNTIGLDQVNNTSDINKPVSTAQQTALNLKMNLTGDGANPWFGAVSVHASGSPSIRQGSYLYWNEFGDGHTSLVNNRGDGIGGFTFRSVNKNNVVETGRVTIDGSGSLSSTGSITAAGSIYGANGAVVISQNGNIHGSLWGGWLSNYFDSVLLQTSNLMTNIAAQGVGGIGTYAFLRNTSGATVGPGGQVDGTSLQWADHARGTSGVVGYGSWRCMGHGQQGNSTVWVRYA